MADREVTVWECVSCEGRGRSAGAIRHVIICADQSEARPITFTLPGGVSPPTFGAGRP